MSTRPGRFTRTDKLAHARHAKIARRVAVSKAVAVAPTGQISLINSHRLIPLVRSSTARNRVLLKTNFLSGFKVIWVVSPDAKDISFRKSEIVVASAIPSR
jgi:hypothetical protein